MRESEVKKNVDALSILKDAMHLIEWAAEQEVNLNGRMKTWPPKLEAQALRDRARLAIGSE